LIYSGVDQGFSTGGKFNDAVVHFSTALVGKQKTGSKFYVRKPARDKRENKVENPWCRAKERLEV